MAGELRASGFLIYRVLGEIEYLLLQASDGTHHWSPPKGHLEPGEDSKKTAIRETEEEAGLCASMYDIIEDFKVTLQYTAREKPKTVDYWLAKLKNPETQIILSSEHQDYKWVNVDTAGKMTYNNLAETLRKAENFLHENETKK